MDLRRPKVGLGLSTTQASLTCRDDSWFQNIFVGETFLQFSLAVSIGTGDFGLSLSYDESAIPHLLKSRRVFMRFRLIITFMQSMHKGRVGGILCF